MKTIISSRPVSSLLLLAFVSCLFSFTEKRGGDSYTIHLNDRVILQRYVHSNKALQPVSISDASANDVLSVRYSHCGKIGTSRSLAIKDASDNILKEIHFKDVSGENGLSMSVPLKDIFAARKNVRTIKIFYSSKELSNDMMLASIDFSGDVKASVGR